MPQYPSDVIFLTKAPAAVATPEPLAAKSTLVTSAVIKAFKPSRAVNTGNVYLGGIESVFDATLNIAIDNDTSVGLTPVATSSSLTTSGQQDHQAEVAVVAGTIEPGVKQVETATAAGTITGDGDLEVVVTGAAISGSPLTVPVAVLTDDEPADWAAKVRAALEAVSAITDEYDVGGVGELITLTAVAEGANDATLNIAIDNDTSTGATTAATSANTTAGVAPGDGNVEVTITSAVLDSSPLTVAVAVAAGDTAAEVAAKIRAELADTAALTKFFDVSGADTDVIITRNDRPANDVQYFPLTPGQELPISAGEDGFIDLNKIYVDAATLNDGVCVVAVRPAGY